MPRFPSSDLRLEQGQETKILSLVFLMAFLKINIVGSEKSAGPLFHPKEVCVCV